MVQVIRSDIAGLRGSGHMKFVIRYSSREWVVEYTKWEFRREVWDGGYKYRNYSGVNRAMNLDKIIKEARELRGQSPGKCQYFEFAM